MQVPSGAGHFTGAKRKVGDFLGCYHRKSQRAKAQPRTGPAGDHRILSLPSAQPDLLSGVRHLPMILCVVTSFFDSTMNRADVFVGLANYKELFADKIFLGALKNTFIIVIVSVPVTCAFSLWVSSAIVDLPEWATSLSAACSTCPLSPVLLPLPLSGSGCTTITMASSTIWARRWV